MSARRMTPLLVVAALAPGLTACIHPWPPAARGGLSGQPAPTPEIAGMRVAIDRAAVTGALPPADAFAARERLDLAAREYRAGLSADAEAGLLDVSVRLGGSDVATAKGRKTCLKAPCT